MMRCCRLASSRLCHWQLALAELQLPSATSSFQSACPVLDLDPPGSLPRLDFKILTLKTSGRRASTPAIRGEEAVSRNDIESKSFPPFFSSDCMYNDVIVLVLQDLFKSNREVPETKSDFRLGWPTALPGPGELEGVGVGGQIPLSLPWPIGKAVGNRIDCRVSARYMTNYC